MHMRYDVPYKKKLVLALYWVIFKDTKKDNES